MNRYWFYRKWKERHIGIVIVLVLVGMLCVGEMVKAQNAISLQVEVADTRGVLLMWESNDKDAVYQIEKSQVKDGTFDVIAAVSGQEGDVVCYDYDVQLGKTYYYKVKQIEENQLCAESMVIEVKVTLPPPSNVTAKKINGSKIKLSWDKVDGANGYVIYRSNESENGFKKIGTSKKTEFIDTKIKNGSVYYYKIAAVKANEKELNSRQGEATAVYLKPEAPKINGSYGNKKIKITWKKIAGADTYYIYKKNSSGEYIKIGETDKLYYTDKKVKKGKSYEYQVIASYQRDGKVIKSKKSKSCKILAAALDPNKKMVALTFDDGPGRYTIDIVNCLKKNNAKATFFVIGCNIDSYKKSMQAADEIGCEIGNHSYSHSNLTRLSETEIKEQISKTDKKIETVIGKSPALMRTPGGAANDTVKKLAGKPIIMWSIDTLDWKTRDRDKTVKAVMSNVKDGDIILMHDIYEPTKEAAEILISKLQQEGYQLVTVSELAQYRGYTLKKGEIYHSLRKK